MSKLPLKILVGDCRKSLKALVDESIQCVITSPPYFNLRDYGTADWIDGDPDCDHWVPNGGFGKNSQKQQSNWGSLNTQAQRVCPKCGARRSDSQIGLEETPEEYVNHLVDVFREVRRVLRPDGTVWLNIGDSYAGSGKGGNPGDGGKQATNKGSLSVRGRITLPSQWPSNQNQMFDGVKAKDLIGVPWMVAFALRADGWYLRQTIIWSKPNPMPESISDRCTTSHEYIFLLAKSGKPTIWRAIDTMEWSSQPDLSEQISVAKVIPSGGLLPPEVKSEKYVAENREATTDKKRKVDDKIPRWEGFSYYFDQEKIREPVKAGNQGKTSAPASGAHRMHIGTSLQHQYTYREVKGANKRSVWTVGTPMDGSMRGMAEDHYATWPTELVKMMIKAGSPEGATVLDPFGGSGTTALVAAELGRGAVICELNDKYANLSLQRIGKALGLRLSVDFELTKEEPGQRQKISRPVIGAR